VHMQVLTHVSVADGRHRHDRPPQSDWDGRERALQYITQERKSNRKMERSSPTAVTLLF